MSPEAHQMSQAEVHDESGGWMWLRQGFFAIVAAYLAAFGLMNLVLGGYDQLWLYPETPWIAYYVSATTAHLLVALLIVFSLSYLDAARYCPRLSLLLRGFALWMGVGALISVAGQYDQIVRVFYVVVLVLLPLLGLLYLLMFRHARMRAVTTALMFVPTLIAGALHAGRNLGALPPDWWTGWFWDAATLAQAPFALVVLVLRLVDERQKMVRAQHREHAQRLFLDMISHELRTPLAVMTTALANIEQGALAQNPALAPRFKRAHAAASRIGMLVDKALAMERLADDSGGIDLQPVRPADLLARFERQFYLEPPHRLALERSGSNEPVLLDSSWLGVAVSNLLDNAVKYSPAGGDIRLLLDRDADRLRIEVIDSGIGIPPEERAGIFGRFVRGQSAEQLTGVSGSGLGLYLVEQIATRHGGSVTVGDGEGSDTRISIDLPAG
jgi:signal transduction histidine kinase